MRTTYFKTLKELNIFILSLVGIGVMMLPSCKNHAADEEKVEKFCISDTLMKMVEFDVAKKSGVEGILKLNGRFIANQDKTVKIFPLVGGIVEKVNVELGDYVKEGQVLAVIRSTDIANADNDLVAAQHDATLAQKNLDKTKDMYNSGLTSELEYITAQKEFEKAESNFKRMKEIRNIYGAIGSNSEYYVKAPISGFIVEKNIAANMQIREDNNEDMFIVANLDKVWLIANVYETDIDKVKVGDDVSVTSMANPDKVLISKVDKVFNVLDPESRVMKIRIVLDNADTELKPEMLASVVLHYNNDEQMISIPSKALIFDNNRYFVMIYKDKCNIETRVVIPTQTTKDITYIKNGLEEGEKIITRSQLLIYDQLND